MQHGSDCPRAAAASQRASHYAGMHFAAAADDGDENRRNYAAGINIIGNQQQVQDTFSLQGQKTGRYNQDAHGSAAKACARLFEKIVGHDEAAVNRQESADETIALNRPRRMGAEAQGGIFSLTKIPRMSSALKSAPKLSGGKIPCSEMPIAVMAAAITNNPPADAIQDVLAVAWLRELKSRPYSIGPTTKLPPSIKR